MCVNCEIYGADHDGPTEPGIKPSNLRVHRAFDQYDAIMFDAPILPLTYVGRRKSEVLAERREITFNIWFCAVIAFIGLTVITLAL